MVTRIPCGAFRVCKYISYGPRTLATSAPFRAKLERCVHGRHPLEPAFCGRNAAANDRFWKRIRLMTRSQSVVAAQRKPHVRQHALSLKFDASSTEPLSSALSPADRAALFLFPLRLEC